jgi:hypothetical protein
MRARKNSTGAQQLLIQRGGRDTFGRARCGKTTFTSTRSSDLTMPSVLYRATKAICVCTLTIEGRYPAGLTESLSEDRSPPEGDTRWVLRLPVICAGSNEVRSRPQASDRVSSTADWIDVVGDKGACALGVPLSEPREIVVTFNHELPAGRAGVL